MVKRCKSKLWISAGGWKGFGNLRVRERFNRQKESNKAMKKVIKLRISTNGHSDLSFVFFSSCSRLFLRPFLHRGHGQSTYPCPSSPAPFCFFHTSV